MKAKGGSWPSQDDIIDALVGLSIESLGGKGAWRKDHIADQTFVQGLTTHDNKYDFVTLGTFESHVFHRTAEAAGGEFLGVDQDRPVRRLIRTRIECPRLQTLLPAACFTPPFCSGGRRASARVRRAEDRQSGVRLVLRARRLFRHHLHRLRAPVRRVEWLILPGLIISGLLLGFIGPPIERVLRTVYDRDESFQLLLTFALVLMFQDVFKFVWGANPRSLDSGYLIYGTISAGDFSVPVYNLLVIAAAIAVAAGLGALSATDQLRPYPARARRKIAPWRRRSASMCDASIRSVFTLGAVLGTTAGALVVPTAAASLDMAIEFVIEAFAVVVIGGLGSMRGALAGALIVGLIRALVDRALSRAGGARDLSDRGRACCFSDPPDCSGDRWHEALCRGDRRCMRHSRARACCRWRCRPITPA